MSLDVAMADPMVLLLVWVALPVAFAGAAWWTSGHAGGSSLLILWGTTTLALAALGAWLAPPIADRGIAGATSAGLVEAFLRFVVVVGCGLAAVALLTRRQRANGYTSLTFGLVLRSVVAFAGIGVLLLVATVALTAARELSPSSRHSAFSGFRLT